MLDGLYERDALAWAEHQAALLRRVSAGKRPIEAVDWAHVIEEVANVGLSELRACQSLRTQAMAHLLKLHAVPGSQAAGHRREEAGVFLDNAAQRFTPSMRQRITLDELYAKALRRARSLLPGVESRAVLPEACPFTVDELLAGDVQALTTKLAKG